MAQNANLTSPPAPSNNQLLAFDRLFLLLPRARPAVSPVLGRSVPPRASPHWLRTLSPVSHLHAASLAKLYKYRTERNLAGAVILILPHAVLHQPVRCTSPILLSMSRSAVQTGLNV